MARQVTLFETWRSGNQDQNQLATCGQPTARRNFHFRKPSNENDTTRTQSKVDILAEDDDDDDEKFLSMAIEASKIEYEMEQMRKRNCSDGAGPSNPGTSDSKRFKGCVKENEHRERLKEVAALKKNRFAKQPLRLIARTDVSENAASASKLCEYVHWQDRSQSSFCVKPSSLRKAFVELMSGKERYLPTPPADSHGSTDLQVSPFRRPFSPAPSAEPAINEKPTVRTVNKHVPQQSTVKEKPSKSGTVNKRGLKYKRVKTVKANTLDSDNFAQLTISPLLRADTYTTASGERLNLAEIFPLVKSGKVTRPVNYQYRKVPADVFTVPSLKPVDILRAVNAQRSLTFSDYSKRGAAGDYL